MAVDRKRLGLAIGTSAVFLGLLAMAVDWESFTLSHVRAELLASLVAVYLAVIAGRALALRSLAPAGSGTGFGGWLRLSARHQMLFTVAPSGSGDLGFPYLAKRYAGIATSDATRMIAQFRLRDAAIILMFAVSGLGWQQWGAGFGIPALVVCVVLLARIDLVAAAGFRLASRIAGSGKVAQFLAEAGGRDPDGTTKWVQRAAPAVATWFFAGFGVALACAAAGRPLDVAEVLTVLAFANLAGALAISIAGFGVAEAGLAGALIASGDHASQAAATALVARPLMLLGILAAAFLWDVGVTAGRRLFSGAARQ